MSTRGGLPLPPGNHMNMMRGPNPGLYRPPPSPYQRPGMIPGARMPVPGMPVGSPMMPGYGAGPPMRPAMNPMLMEPFRKRLMGPQGHHSLGTQRRGVKRRKMADKVLPQRIRELVPESQAYMDLLAFERKLDQTIARKRMEIQDAIKKPLTQKRKLRIYISNTFTPAKPDGEEAERVSSWELRVEGKLLDDPSKQKRKFSSFFKSLVIELDRELYGPDNHLVEWHRMATTQETDGFQVKRPGDVNVKCTLLLMLDHQNNKLQDSHEKEYINCNRYFRQIFNCVRMRFSDIPMKLASLLQHPDPIIINHTISPQDFIQDWLQSQSRDLKIMTDVMGNPEEERHSEFYEQPWTQEAVGRYVFFKVQQRRQELEQVLGIRLT
uniref:DM2 domain-containing protein n=1 Tax=Pyxicephalus adspersus TaxID=30357 RepID=A0AAV3A3V0_PYXAD|nr:TPA: hypothetical protein GDO54_013222 [Pyxicephalus adspersus]